VPSAKDYFGWLIDVDPTGIGYPLGRHFGLKCRWKGLILGCDYSDIMTKLQEILCQLPNADMTDIVVRRKTK